MINPHNLTNQSLTHGRLPTSALTAELPDELQVVLPYVPNTFEITLPPKDRPRHPIMHLIPPHISQTMVGVKYGSKMERSPSECP